MIEAIEHREAKLGQPDWARLIEKATCFFDAAELELQQLSQVWDGNEDEDPGVEIPSMTGYRDGLAGTTHVSTEQLKEIVEHMRHIATLKQGPVARVYLDLANNVANMLAEVEALTV